MKNLFTLLFTVLALSGFAQDGSKDLTFGTNGFATIPITGDASGGGIEMLSNGKFLSFTIIVDNGDQYLPTVRRFNADGSVDATFGTNGVYTIAQGANAINPGYKFTVDGQNRPIVVSQIGSNNVSNDFITIHRLLEDGGLDYTFGTSGVETVNYPYYSRLIGVLVRPNGKILLVAESYYDDYLMLTQFNDDGTNDPSFGVAGTIVHNFGFELRPRVLDLTLQADGKILLCGDADLIWGEPMAIVRFQADGYMDNTFDSDGIKYLLVGGNGDHASSIHAYPNGKILVSGGSRSATNDMRGALAAFNEDGSTFSMFSSGSTVLYDPGSFNSMVVQPDGKILVTGGTAGIYTVYRYNADGTLDPTFDDDGKAHENSPAGTGISPHSLALAQDGGVIVGAEQGPHAETNIEFLKLNNALTVSITETNTVDFNIYPNPTSEALIVNLAELKGNNASIRVIDALGKEVISTSDVTGNNTTLDVNHLVKGTYFGTITSGSESGSFQFIKN